jgi:hypothetical protein
MYYFESQIIWIYEHYNQFLECGLLEFCVLLLPEEVFMKLRPPLSKR